MAHATTHTGSTITVNKLKRTNYTKLEKVAREYYNDHGFCAVIATSIAFDLSFGKAKAILERDVKALGLAGFSNGARYDVITDADCIILTLNDDGKRKVAGSAARPIIDLNSKKAVPFNAGDRVCVEYSYKLITITIEGV